MEELLWCSRCKKDKSPDDFYFHKKEIYRGQRSRYCKSCSSTYHKKYIKQNREQINSRAREYRKARKLAGNPLPKPNYLLANGGICAYPLCKSKRVSKSHSYCLEHSRLRARVYARRRSLERKAAKQAAHDAGVFPRPRRRIEIIIEYLEHIQRQALQIGEQGQVKPVT